MNTSYRKAPLTLLAILYALGLFTLLLSGCSDKEPEERKAFIVALEKHMGDKGPSIKFSEQELKDSGQYATQLDLLKAFEKGLMEAVMQDSKSLSGLSGLQTPGDVLKNKDKVLQAQTACGKIVGNIQEQRKKAADAYAALKQPEDLKAVYAKAYDKAVSTPGQMMETTFSSMKQLLDIEVEFIGFLEKNKDGIRINGQTYDITDAKLEKSLDEFISRMDSTQQELAKNMSEMNKLRR